MSRDFFNVHTEEARESMRMLRLGVRQAIHQAVVVAVRTAEVHAKSTTLFKDQRAEGGTRSTIKGKVSGFKGRVSARGATRYLECGTRPHEIVARRKGKLRFEAAGQVFFRKRVMHPGTAPRPFMKQARDAGQTALNVAAHAFIDHAIRRHNGG